MNLGDVLETSFWLTGTETPELLAHHREQVCQSLLTVMSESGFVSGPVGFTEKKPGEDRVPPVPDHIQGPDVRLLVAEATVIAKVPELGTRRFVGDLDEKDLARLRQITRQNAPRPLSDAECDDVIEELGPEAAGDVLRKQGRLH